MKERKSKQKYNSKSVKTKNTKTSKQINNEGQEAIDVFTSRDGSNAVLSPKSGAFTFDPGLKPFCTERQLEILAAWETYGSQRAAAQVLGISSSNGRLPGTLAWRWGRCRTY